MSRVKFIIEVKMRNIHFIRISFLMMLQFFISSFLMIKPVSAQQCNEVTLNEARKAYELGKFDLVISSLEPCIKSGFNEKQKIEAHRLKAIAYLSMDSTAQALLETDMLLQINPSYDPNLFDPAFFISMVNKLKFSG
ncbi:MAG: hypothetical protein Q7V19_10220, partial [Bacteroidales bacterium]|nr:hypothetical protein [Bacteroidales bacterium]